MVGGLNSKSFWIQVNMVSCLSSVSNSSQISKYNIHIFNDVKAVLLFKACAPPSTNDAFPITDYLTTNLIKSPGLSTAGI